MTTGHRMSRADAGVQTTSKNEQGRVVCRGYLMLCVEKEETQEGREPKFKYQMAYFGGKVQILGADGKFWGQMAFFCTTPPTQDRRHVTTTRNTLKSKDMTNKTMIYLTSSKFHDSRRKRMTNTRGAPEAFRQSKGIG